MAITWSRLHEVLGLEPRALTHDDILYAIKQNVPEDAALDFKGERRTDEHAKGELGKDVAAMANTGGGIIVFGVGEEGEGTSKHLVATPVELVDQVEQQIRSIVWERVRPIVSDIEVEQIPDPDHPTKAFTLLSIPASPDAPHFYEKSGQHPVAPRRHGSHSESMREQEIERAYRDRFARLEDMATVLSTAVENTVDYLRPSTGPWTVLVSRPTAPVPLGVLASTRDGAQNAIHAASRRGFDLIGRDEPPSLLRSVTLNVRTGLRRWVFRQPSQDPTATTEGVYVELHHDGQVVLAAPSQARRMDGSTYSNPVVNGLVVEQAIMAAVMLTYTWLANRGVSGGALLRATVIANPADQRPLSLHGLSEPEPRRYGVPSWSFRSKSVHPVDVQLLTPVTAESRLATAVELAEGVYHQFGTGLLAYLPVTDA